MKKQQEEKVDKEDKVHAWPALHLQGRWKVDKKHDWQDNPDSQARGNGRGEVNRGNLNPGVCLFTVVGGKHSHLLHLPTTVCTLCTTFCNI